MTSRALSVLAVIATMAIAGTASAASFTETLVFTDLDNDGYVTPSSPLTYTHSLVSADPILSVDAVHLSIAITDDFECASWTSCRIDWFGESETAVISVNGLDWQNGQATAQIFFGDVTLEAQLTQVQMDMEVTISSSGLDLGDFQVWQSRMDVDFTIDDSIGGVGQGGPGAPMPEPSAAFVFLLGSMTVSMGIRRRK